MKKTKLLLIQIFILFSIFIPLSSDTVTAHMNYLQIISKFEIIIDFETRPPTIVEFYFPPNSSAKHLNIQFCFNSPARYIEIDYHLDEHNQRVIDFVDCF